MTNDPTTELERLFPSRSLLNNGSQLRSSLIYPCWSLALEQATQLYCLSLLHRCETGQHYSL